MTLRVAQVRNGVPFASPSDAFAERPGTCVGGVEGVVPAAAIFNALPVSFLRLVIVRRPQPRAFEAATASPSRGEGRARQMTRTCKSLRVGGSAGSSC